jgi:hypothetical protein
MKQHEIHLECDDMDEFIEKLAVLVPPEIYAERDRTIGRLYLALDRLYDLVVGVKVPSHKSDQILAEVKEVLAHPVVEAAKRSVGGE